VRLVGRGDDVIVVDDLSTGNRFIESIAPLFVMDLADKNSAGPLAKLLSEHRIDAVMHFAGKKRVDESILRPDWYFQQNVGALETVLRAMAMAGVKDIVFSSTAAVYGEVSAPVSEKAETRPLNPYGESKLTCETLLVEAARTDGLRAASLRYFNVAGSDSYDLRDRTISNLIPIVVGQISRGESPVIFGSDYDTDDGTCVRDFIHVADLADAHLAVLHSLPAPGENLILNVGTGRGYSVLSVVDEVNTFMGKSVEPEIGPRREGDPANVVARVGEIYRRTGWKAHRGLAEIVASTVSTLPESA